MYVSRPVLLHHRHNHPPSVVVLAERLTGCLSTELTCLHGSGPPPALWLPPIDLFQETLAAVRPEIKEEGVGVQRTEGHFTGVPFWLCCWSRFFLFLSFCGSYMGLGCVETIRKEPTKCQVYYLTQNTTFILRLDSSSHIFGSLYLSYTLQSNHAEHKKLSFWKRRPVRQQKLKAAAAVVVLAVNMLLFSFM